MNAFINEFHYDNDGSDTGEFIEIAGPAGMDLTGFQIVLYNGNGGSQYNTVTLSETLTDSGNGFGFVTIDIAGIQNGSPDGIALVDASGAVLEFISYEGSFTAADGPASGMTSTDIGVSEPGNTPAGFSLQRAGEGALAADFTFQEAQAETRGAVNTGQTFVAATAPTLISEFQPNPDGADPANVTIELSGEAGEMFSGTLLSIENDGVNGLIDRLADVSGTFDENGLLTVEIPDLENPSFTFVLTDGTGTAMIGDDLDADDDGMIDDASVLGTVLDAIGIPDSDADADVLYAEQLGGTNFAFTGTEPELVFRSGSTGELFAVNDVVSGTEIFNTAAETFSAADFDQNPIVNDTFGAINPTFDEDNDNDPDPVAAENVHIADTIVARLDGGVLNGAEIVATLPSAGLAFTTSGDGLQIIDFSDIANGNITVVGSIDPSANSENTATEITSVAVNANGVVAISYPGDDEQGAGEVQFYTVADPANPVFVGSQAVGPLPDSLAFNEAGTHVVVANEGESDGGDNQPGADTNPNGSVSIIQIDAATGAVQGHTEFDFSDSSITFDSLETLGVRVNRAAPSAAADIEPEFVTVDGNAAFITLQENNAVVRIDDVTTFSGPLTTSNIIPLGTKDHSLEENALDASNRDDAINIDTYDIQGLYMPDAIATYEVDGVTYFLTANEGDGRGDFDDDPAGDEARGDDLLENFIDTEEVSQDLQDALADDALLGRLKFSTIDGDIDGDGLIEVPHSFGGRSFSIYDAHGAQVYDSANDLETFIAQALPQFFNSQDGNPIEAGDDVSAEFDDRSDDKGIEPEAITTGVIDGNVYAFVGLERVGGVAVFDITDPLNVSFDSYIRNETREDDGDGGTIDADIAPEGLSFVSAEDSPTGAPLLFVSYEDSNSLTVHSLESFTPIHEIQGDSSAVTQVGVDDISPLSGEIVTVQAIVTADFQDGLGGFFIQEEDIDADLNPFTSEGVFIFGDSVDVAVGDLVTVTGNVSEFFGATQISASAIEIISSNNMLPTATEVDLGETGAILDDDGEFVVDLEFVEGMLITIPEALSVTEMFNLDRFAEYRVSAEGRLVQFTQDNFPDEEGFAEHLEDIAARAIVIDDGQSVQNPEIINILDGNDGVLTADDSFRMGDELSNVTGVVRYSFDEFRIDLPTGDYDQVNPRPESPDEVGGDLKIASLNVLNFFTTLDNDSNTTDGGLDPRGADDLTRFDSNSELANTDSNAEFDRQLTKIVNAIVEIDADVLGLVELENSLTNDAISTLVDELNAVLGEGTYAFIDPTPGGDELVGTDAITTGVIYKPAAVTPSGDAQVLVFEETSADTTFAVADALGGFSEVEDFDRNRPAVIQTFVDGEGNEFTVAVNHFKSKGDSGLEDTFENAVSGGAEQALIDALLADPNYDQGGGAGFWNQVRTDAAIELVEFLEGTENVFILGDLNAYAKEDPVQEIIEAGYGDLASIFIGDEAYSFVFDGQQGTLDYILASTDVLDAVTGATEWHINADEADAIDYNLDFGRQSDLFNADSASRNSDHDPIIAGIDFDGADEDVFTLNLLHFTDQEASTGAIVDAPNLSAVLNALRDEDVGADATLTLSSGDAIIPGVFFDASDAIFGLQGVADIQIQNELGVDAIALGNHEFDLGTGLLANLITGEIFDEDTGELLPITFDAELFEGTDLEGATFGGTAFPYLSANLDFSTDANLAPLEVEGGQPPLANVVTSSTVITTPTNDPSMFDGEEGFTSTPILTIGDSVNSTGALNDLNIETGNGAPEYTPVGILDGLGAVELDENTVRVFANHELLNFRGNEYTLSDGAGGTFELTGARISYFDIDKETKQIVDGGIAYDTIIDANGDIATDASFGGTPFATAFGGGAGDGSPVSGFSRFCSANLVEAAQFGENMGLTDTIYFAGEEDGGGFNSIGGGVWALDIDSGVIYDVPAMGNGAWESVTEIDTGTTTHVAFIVSDDSSPFDADDFDANQAEGDEDVEAAPLYLYVGEKDSGTGGFLDQNGLENGKLFVWVADSGVTRPSEFNGLSDNLTEGGTWVEIDNSIDLHSASLDGSTGFDQFGYPTQRTLWTRAEDAGAFGFSRPEDVATNPNNGSEFVLASTGVDTFDVDPETGNGADTFGTMYTMDVDFTDINAPTGGLTIIYDGDADPARQLRSPDNLDWADDGFIYVQEDEAEEDSLTGEPLFGEGAANPNEASIVRLDPTEPFTPEIELNRLGQINRDVILDPTTEGEPVDTDAGSAGEWETSGILDVSTLFGEEPGSLFIYDIQAHGIEDQERVNPDSRINDDDLVEGGQLAFLSAPGVDLGDTAEKIGVVGATTPTLDIISSPGDVGIFPEDFDGDPTDEQLDALAAVIQEEVDALLAANPDMNKVVLLAHMQQLSIEQALAERLTDVDVIIAGGSNTRLFDENDRPRDGDSVQGEYPIFTTDANGEPVAIVNTDGSYKYVGRLVVDFDENGNIIPESYDPEVSGAFATDQQGVEDLGAEDLVDPEIQAIADAVEAQIIATESNVFGVSDVFLNGNRSGVADDAADLDGVRTQETNLGNLTADANLAAAQAADSSVVVSIKNGGGIRASIGETVVPAGGTEAVRLANQELVDGDGQIIKEAGGISQTDIATTLAFNNNLVLLTLTAQELVDVLEHGVSSLPDVAGRFPQVSGVKFSFDPDLPSGDRIVNMGIFDQNDVLLTEVVRDGELVADPSQTFRIVTLGFLAGGGDGYPFPQGEAANAVELDAAGTRTGDAIFADDGTEQDALAEFLDDNFNDGTAFNAADTGRDLDERIQNLNFREDTVLPPLVDDDDDDDDNNDDDGDVNVGTPGGDTLVGGEGGDTLAGGAGGDSLDGGAGGDTLAGGTGRDTIDGGEGDDVALGGVGRDVIDGGEGGDTLGGGQGRDVIDGGTGEDVISGGQGRDTIDGGQGDDVARGGVGADEVSGGQGSDTLFGGRGADNLSGGSEDDELRGGRGDDTLDGGADDDLLIGGRGDDSLLGSGGDDTLKGGRGDDDLTGGRGADTFQFAANDGSDTISDYEDGVDLIEITFGAAGFDELTIVDGENGAVISYANTEITFTGVEAATLDETDFIFS